MGNEISPPGTFRTFRVPPSKSVIDKKKALDQQRKRSSNKQGKSKKPDNDDQVHIDEYI